MKQICNKPVPPPAPSDEKPSAPAPVRSRMGAFCWRAFYWTHCTMARIVLVLVLLLAYLRFVGLPSVLLGRIAARLAKEELFVKMQRVRLDFPASVVVEGLQFFEVPEADSPLLESESVALSFKPSYWFRRRAGFGGLQIRGAVLRIHTAGSQEDRDSPRNLVLEDVNAILGFEAAGIRVEQCDADFVGMRVHGSGFVVASDRRPEEKMSLRDASRTIKAALKNLPPWLPELAEQLNAIEHDDTPKAEFTAHFSPADPLQTDLAVAIIGRRTRVRGVAFDRWSGHVVLREGVLRVGPLSVMQESAYCHLSGSLNLRDRMAECHVYNTLPPQTWLRLVPRRWHERITTEGLSFEGSGSYEVWLGPAPADELLDSMSGWVALDETMFREVWIERAFAHFEKNSERATFNRVEATIGRGALRSTLKGSASLDFGTLKYAVKGEGECDPRVVLPLLTPNQARIVSALDFKTPPRLEARLTGVATNTDLFEMTGRFSGKELKFRGAEMVRFDSEVIASNGVFSFRDMKVERAEGRVEGWVAIDYKKDMVDYDIVSTADPYEVSRILGTNVHAFVRRFRLEGPVRVASRGRVDYGHYKDTDLEAEVTAQNAGMQWLLMDRGSCRIRAVGTCIGFSDVEGSIYGGTFSGSAAIRDVDGDDIQYEFSGELRDADFRRLMVSVRDVNGDMYKGTLSSTVTVAGVLGKGKGPTVTGSGRLSIQKGALFQVPLLGGLSQILSRVYPGLGFATQTDFSSSFTIADSRVCSGDAYMEGTLISVSADGCYYFDERLDMRVHVKLLRRGYVASVLRLVTFPVTKLLEIHLGGTLKEPKWRPHNLPKVIFD